MTVSIRAASKRTLLGCLGAVLGCSSALAADPRPGGAADVDEVTVTARKVEERLIDVPLTITAFSADEIAAAGQTSIRDVAESTPGLFISSSQGRSGDRIAMRGINTVSPTLG
ncbi:MAG: Plug domain-containing protein, partial [Steroidobacteraceae bacterium]